MLVSLEWLRDYVDLPDAATPDKIMHDLTLSTVEVEGVEYPAERLRDVVLAQVRTAEPIEGTKLTLTQCDVGQKDLVQVVCGARNVQVDMFVALALPGASIHPHGASDAMTVGAVTLQGHESRGVICAPEEIGVTGVFSVPDDQSIMSLHELADKPLGTPLADAIGFDDAVFEIDNKSLTNRPDLWGHVGIARELAAIYGVPFRDIEPVDMPPASKSLLSASDTQICNRFTATLFEGIAIDEAPLAMRSRLARVGQRAIDVFVDLTNYVMFATGQPSHAYDADALTGPMCARLPKDGEAVELLDGTVVGAESGVPYIADEAEPLAVAGVMGGERTGVQHTAKRIFLEMANFDARTVRSASQKTGVRTEASARFEKALDTQRIDVGLSLFHQLLREIQPDARATAFQDERYAPTPQATVKVSQHYIDTRLGKSFSPAEVTKQLARLGFDTQFKDGEFAVLAPTWRSTGDVSIPADIVEEVARLHCYDNFNFVAPRVDLQQVVESKRRPLDRRLREALAFAGVQEVFTYPWSRDALLAAVDCVDDSLTLEAPPAPDQGSLRPSLMPNLLEAVIANQRFADEFALFESGSVFPSAGEGEEVAAVFVGADAAKVFRQAKGVLEAVIGRAQLDGLQFAVNDASIGWRDGSACLDILCDGVVVGQLARVNNRCKRLAGIKRGEVSGFVLDRAKLRAHATREHSYARLPDYPGIDLDLSVEIADTVSWHDVRSSLEGSSALLTGVQWLDEYRGKGVREDGRSLTLRIQIAAPDRTLQAEEAEAVRDTALKILGEKFAAKQR